MYEIVNETVLFNKQEVGHVFLKYAFSYFKDTNLLISHGVVNSVFFKTVPIVNILKNTRFNTIEIFYKKMSPTYCDFLNDLIDYNPYEVSDEVTIDDLIKLYFRKEELQILKL